MRSPNPCAPLICANEAVANPAQTGLTRLRLPGWASPITRSGLRVLDWAFSSEIQSVPLLACAAFRHNE